MSSWNRAEEMARRHEEGRPDEPPDPFLRLPGLFRRWEIEQVLDAHHDFHIEEAGTASDGTQLFAVYRREHDNRSSSKEEK